VGDRAPWEKLLREALAILALPADEQVRANGPGCVACDLLNDFDHARIVATGNEAGLSDDQRRSLEAIDTVMRSMEKPDFECFNNEVLGRPVWERLRKLAAHALRLFGWEGTVVGPFVEVERGVWRRQPSTAQRDTTHERDV
jgi:hypothetical protein